MRCTGIHTRLIGGALLGLAAAAQGAGLDCVDWQKRNPAWIWCDDFESDAALSGNYFEVDRANGQFGVSAESPFGGNGALKARYLAGLDNAGGLKLGIGRSPVASNVAGNRDFDEIYWRFYTRTAPGWVGNPRKLTRATVFSASNWAQAAIGHLWEGDGSGLSLGLDPATGVVGSQVVTTKYNDFDNLRWLGKKNGATQIYSPANVGRWFCIEVHMKLNTPQESNGTFSFWVDEKLEAQMSNLNWRGGYTAYGINAVMLENYVNEGFSQAQVRYIDNLVVSTSRIGCQGPSAAIPEPPKSLTVN